MACAGMLRNVMDNYLTLTYILAAMYAVDWRLLYLSALGAKDAEPQQS